MNDPVRPRFGALARQDGSQQPLVFLPTDDPTTFRAVTAGDESPVVFTDSDTMFVDVIGPGQGIQFNVES